MIYVYHYMINLQYYTVFLLCGITPHSYKAPGVIWNCVPNQVHTRIVYFKNKSLLKIHLNTTFFNF